MSIVILSPTAPPAPGGASQWCVQVADGLRCHGFRNVRVISEQHPEAPQGFADGILRRYPFRAGASGRNLSSYARFLTQQIMLTADVFRGFDGATALLIHGSFFYRPTPLALLRHNMPLVIDLRDPLVSRSVARRIGTIDQLHSVVACSESTLDAATTAGVSGAHLIPIPFARPERPGPPPALPTRIADRFVLFTNGTDHRKGIARAVRLTESLRRRGSVDGLVIVGRARETCNELDEAIACGWATHLGPLVHSQVLALMSAAAIVVILSPIEGLSRSALETIAVGGTPLLPNSVPEFARHLPQFVVNPYSEGEVLEVADRLLNGHCASPAYPFELHEPGRVGALYAALFGRLGVDSWDILS